MLIGLSDAKEYVISRIEMMTGEHIDETEREIVYTSLEAAFFDAIQDQVDEKELEEMKLNSPEEVDGYLFHKIPKYATILEEVAAKRLAQYLTPETEWDDQSA